ncbi:DUF434 domain-containing protein [Sulfurovum sp.]|uniref:DUF434 domain-containing protein n=1 Tax=Sulfurovum sp. TaxID=1969726 RepID=UPI0025F06B75|nr:DUF434 domain-containing protein [Sulfurovum sp.]
MPLRHRGVHPKDTEYFAKSQLPKLATAVEELSWLLGRRYSMKAALTLVGDHHQLSTRQRLAVGRIACADGKIAARQSKRVGLEALKGREILIDGFNLIITIETALGGGAVFDCLDGCYRDLSSVYGSYRPVEETLPAIELIGNLLAEHHPKQVNWLFDRPVSNSGRLAGMVQQVGDTHNWPFTTETTDRTDALLTESRHIVVSCDSAILDRTAHWCNLAREVIAYAVPDAWIIDLKG